jgi:hypothetical protein
MKKSMSAKTEQLKEEKRSKIIDLEFEYERRHGCRERFWDFAFCVACGGRGEGTNAKRGLANYASTPPELPLGSSCRCRSLQGTNLVQRGVK